VVLTGGEPLLQVDDSLITAIEKGKYLYCDRNKWNFKSAKRYRLDLYEPKSKYRYSVD